MIANLLLLTLGVLPLEGGPLSDRVDLIEVNHVFSPEGRPTFAQCIFYTWQNERYEVVAWRGLKSADQWPHRNYVRGGFTTIWYDGDVLRRVDAYAIRETWTQYDVELAEREILPKHLRRELRQPSQQRANETAPPTP